MWPPATELEQILAEAGAAPTPEQEEAIRECACRFADAARAHGTRPEQIVAALRSIFRASGDLAPDAMVQRVIDWCLRRYFKTDG